MDRTQAFCSSASGWLRSRTWMITSCHHTGPLIGMCRLWFPRDGSSRRACTHIVQVPTLLGWVGHKDNELGCKVTAFLAQFLPMPGLLVLSPGPRPHSVPVTSQPHHTPVSSTYKCNIFVTSQVHRMVCLHYVPVISHVMSLSHLNYIMWHVPIISKLYYLSCPCHVPAALPGMFWSCSMSVTAIALLCPTPWNSLHLPSVNHRPVRNYIQFPFIWAFIL